MTDPERFADLLADGWAVVSIRLGEAVHRVHLVRRAMSIRAELTTLELHGVVMAMDAVVDAGVAFPGYRQRLLIEEAHAWALDHDEVRAWSAANQVQAAEWDRLARFGLDDGSQTNVVTAFRGQNESIRDYVQRVLDGAGMSDVLDA